MSINGMNVNPDHIPAKKTYYKQTGFYIKSIFAIVISLFILLLATIIALRWVNPPATSFTLQQNWEELGSERYSLRDHWVSSDEIPYHMKWAVIASEDQLFLEHWGFDIESMQEAWEERQQGKRVRGASTISQQVAKNLFLTPAETYLRKGVEAGITVLIEVFWPKDRIIEVYLNIAEFGPGIFGIGKASESFFNISASSLDPEMATQLAAVLPSPKRMRVNPPSPYTEERSDWILRQMTHLTGIAYHQPSQDEENIDAVIESEQPDTLSSINNAEFHFSQADSMIRSINSDLNLAYDSLRVDIPIDSLNIQN